LSHGVKLQRLPGHLTAAPVRGSQVLLSATALAAVFLLGLVVLPTTEEFGHAPLFVSAFSVLAATLIVIRGPVACLALIGAATSFGVNLQLVSVSQIDVYVADLFYVLLIAFVLAQWALRRPPLRQQRVRGLEFWPIVFFLAFVGFTVGLVALRDPSFLPISAISWLRLLQTASLIPLVVQVVRQRDDVVFLLGSIALGGLGASAIGTFQLLTSGSLMAGRFGGPLSINTLGLVSALLIVAAVFPGITRSLAPRLAMFLAGILGLIASKSIGGISAAVVAVGVGALLTHPRRGAFERAIKAIVLVTIGTLLVLGFVRSFRPELVPGSPQFGYSSATHRLVLGASGLQLFIQHPLIGVGWQRSASPDVIGSVDVVDAVRARFSEGVNPYFFPNVTPSSVHNTYIQLLAELGILGFSLFAFLILKLGGGIHRLLKQLRHTPEMLLAHQLTLSLIAILTWWNDNPLYGGQTESVLASLFLGSLFALQRLCAGPRSGTVGPRPLPIHGG
jgi:O-antigen ligase